MEGILAHEIGKVNYGSRKREPVGGGILPPPMPPPWRICLSGLRHPGPSGPFSLKTGHWPVFRALRTPGGKTERKEFFLPHRKRCSAKIHPRTAHVAAADFPEGGTAPFKTPSVHPDQSEAASDRYFLLAAAKQIRHMATWTTVEQGVARPMWNMEAGVSRLIRKATGIRMRKAPAMP